MEQASNKVHQIVQILVVLVRILIVIFLITGIVQLFKAVFKTVAFDEYPLPSYSYRITTPDGKETQVDEKQIKVERKLQMLEDYSGAITLLLLSGGLYWLMQKKIKDN